MGLGSLFGGLGKVGTIKDLLETYERREKTPPLTVESFVRASGFYKLCAREEVLRSVHAVEREDIVSPALQLTFDHGTALHWVLQNVTLPKLGVLLGKWFCLDCGAVYGVVNFHVTTPLEAAVHRPEKCCQESGNFRFEEYDLIDDQYRITGHCDGFLGLSGYEGLGILEAKSIGTSQVWKIKNAPKVEHVLQAQIYMWLTGAKWAIVLYWEKGGYGTKSIKEYYVDRDESIIAKVKATLQSMWTGMAGGATPDRICLNAECERALGCPVRVQCFEGYAPEPDDGVGTF